MSEVRKTVTSEICQSIATAIVERWVKCDKDHRRVMELVFKTDARTAAADLSEEMYRLVEHEYSQFLPDLIKELLPHIENEIQDLYLMFIEDNKELFDQLEETLCRA